MRCAAPGACQSCASACIWCWWRASRCCRPPPCPTWWMHAGNFRTDMARAGAAMFFLPKVRRQLEAEIEAQFAAFGATGLAARSCQRPQAFSSASHHRRADGEDRQAPWRARARGCRWSRRTILRKIEKHRRLRHRGADRAFRARLARPFPPRRHRRARSGVRPGLVGGDARQPAGGSAHPSARGPVRDLHASGHRATIRAPRRV